MQRRKQDIREWESVHGKSLELRRMFNSMVLRGGKAKKKREKKPGDTPSSKDVSKIVSSYSDDSMIHRRSLHNAFSGIDMLEFIQNFNNKAVPPNIRSSVSGRPSRSRSFRNEQSKWIRSLKHTDIRIDGLRFSYRKKNKEWSMPMYPRGNSKSFGAIVKKIKFNNTQKDKTGLSIASRRLHRCHTVIQKIAASLAKDLKRKAPEIYRNLRSIAKKSNYKMHFGGLWSNCSVQVNMTSYYHRDTRNLGNTSTIIVWSDKDQGSLLLPEKDVGFRYTNSSVTSGNFVNMLHGTTKISPNRVSFVFYCM